ILVLAKGAASGYWPLGLAVAAGPVHDTIAGAGGLTHGLTYSHHLLGAAAGRAVLRVLRERHLVEAAETQGKRLRAGLEARLGDHPAAGDIRGPRLMVAVELAAARATRAPVPPPARPPRGPPPRPGPEGRRRAGRRPGDQGTVPPRGPRPRAGRGRRPRP